MTTFYRKRAGRLCVCTCLLALAGLVPAAHTEAAATFGSATNLTAGTNPQAIAIADFNGDAVNDLAVVNNGTNNVSVFLGASNGTFGSATNFSVGNGPIAVAAADLNGDGKQDLVVANGNIVTVSVLIGDGAGSFAAAVGYGAMLAGFPSGLALGDFNGANDKDILVTNAVDAVTMLLNNGSGVFGAPSSAATVGAGPTFIAAVDLDGDADIDFVDVNGDGDSISIGLNNGSGSFTISSKAVGDDPIAVTSGDFDGDGDQDLAVANYLDSNVSVLLGTGTGTFGSATNYAVGTNPFSVTAADLDGDGKVDLATANNTDNNVSILIGAGNGTFGTATSLAAGSSATFVRAADFSGDGKLDLAVANYSDGNVSIFLNTTPAAASTNSGGAGLSEFVRQFQNGFTQQYAARSYMPRDLLLTAKQCAADACDIALQFTAPKDAELERFSLRHGENKQRITFEAERDGETITLRFPWPLNTELPARVCYAHQSNAEFCAESRIWTPAAIAAKDVRIEQLRLSDDKYQVTLHIPSFHNFSYLAAGKTSVAIDAYDANGNLTLRQSVNRPGAVRLLLDPQNYTIRLTPKNAAGEEGATVTIPLDISPQTMKGAQNRNPEINTAQQNILHALMALLAQLMSWLTR